MSTPELYESIRRRHLDQVRAGDILMDEHLNDLRSDRRLGISLIIPVLGLRGTYGGFITRMAAIEPRQYYYPFPDLHVTVFDFLRGSASYRADAGLEEVFSAIVETVTGNLGRFSIHFRGTVFTREAGIVPGFDGGTLVVLRNRLREELKVRGIPNDERYESRSAHMTFCRFRQELADLDAFVRLTEDLAGIEFGAEEVTRLELVEHDWYNTEARKRLIRTFELK